MRVCLVLNCTAAGVFVHCWSSLLSPICCNSLAQKQDRERFHTYTHWPLINKSDQGPFPHIHTTQMKTKTIHTQKHPRAHFSRSRPHLSSQRIRPGNTNFCLSNVATYSDVSIAFFFFFTLSDDCSPVAPSVNTRRLVPISCSLSFFLNGMNQQVLLCEFVI